MRRLLLPLILLALALPAAATLTMDTNHPTVFVRESGMPAGYEFLSLDSIRVRLGIGSPGEGWTEDDGAPNAKALDALKLDYAASLTTPIGTSNISASRCASKAFYFWTTGDTTGVDALTDYLAAQANSTPGSAGNVGDGDWNSGEAPKFNPMILAITLMKPVMEPWKVALVNTAMDNAENSADNSGNIPQQAGNIKLHGPIFALSGASGLTFNPQTGADFTDTWFINTVVPCWNEMSPNGAADGYFGKYDSSFNGWALNSTISGDHDLIALATCLAGKGAFWNRVLRTTLTSGTPPAAAIYKLRQVQAKYNGNGADPQFMLAFYAGVTGSEEAQVRLKAWYDGTTAANFPPLATIAVAAWCDMSWSPYAITATPIHWWDMGRSWYIGETFANRDGAGNPSTTGGDTWLYVSTPPGTEEQQTARQLQLERNTDPIIPAGSYYSSDSDMVHWYGKHAGALNSIAIDDPADWRADSIDIDVSEDQVRLALDNFGQQRGENTAAADAKWPHCNTPAYDDDSPFTFIGEFDAVHAYGDTAVAIYMDNGDAFEDSLATSWHSIVAHYVDHGFVLVMDRMVLGVKPNLEVASYINSVNAPALDATPTTIEGEWGVGGVFEAVNFGADHPWTQTVNDSRGIVYVTKATASAGSPVATHEIIGGAVRVAGTPTNWVQNSCPPVAGGHADYLNYNASLQSWEFVLKPGGRNWAPDWAPTNRHSYTSASGRQQIAPDYKSRILVTGAAALSTVDIAYAVEVVASTTAAHEVVSATTGSVVATGMHNGTSWVVDVRLLPGVTTGVSSLAWTSPLDAGDTGSFQAAWNLAPNETWSVKRNGVEVATTTSDANGTAFFSPSGAGDGAMTMELGEGEDAAADAGGRGGRRGTRRVNR